MFKLSGSKELGNITFEQIFYTYGAMKEKQNELIALGMLTIVTPMNEDQLTKYKQDLLNKAVDLTKDSVIN